MLDRLPVELLQHVLQLAFPLRYNWRVYKQRRRDLRSLSLVSKRVKAVAQSMLPEVFALREDSAGRLLLPKNDRQPRMRDIRALFVCPSSDSVFRSPSFDERQWTLLAQLVALKCDLSWQQAANCRALRRLELYGCQIQLDSPSLQFPCAAYLVCDRVIINPSDLHIIFSPSTFPALKVLSVPALLSPDTPSPSRLVVSPLAWSNQLLAYNMSWYDASRIDPALLSLPHLLVDYYLDVGDEPAFHVLPAQVRLIFSEIVSLLTDSTSTVHLDIRALTAKLKSVPSTVECPLRVLVLPRPFRTPPKGRAHADAVQSLLDECVTRAVEVLWDDEGVEGAEAVWLIPPSFIDYRRRKMRDEADKEADKEVNEAA